MGHSEPFSTLRMIGNLNKQWDEQYIEPLSNFNKNLKEEVPNIQLISSAGPSPDDRRFKYALAGNFEN